MVTRLTGGLTGLAKQRKVTTIVGTATFTGDHIVSVGRTGRHASTVRNSTPRSSPPAPNP